MSSMEKNKTDIKSLVRKYFNNGNIDILFLIAVLALLAAGLTMLYSASYPYAESKYNDTAYIIKRQVLFALVGIFVMIAFSHIKVELWKKCTWIVMGITLALLLVVFVLPQQKPGFYRWIDIGPISFQPSEIAKFAVILAGAYLYSKYATRMSSKKPSMLPIPAKINEKLGRGIIKESWVPTWVYVFIFALFAVLVYLENHLSCFLLIACLGIVMMFIGGVRKGWFIVGIAAVTAVVLMVCVPIYQDIKAEDEAMAAAEEAGIEYVAPENDEDDGFFSKILQDYMGERIVAWLDKDYEPTGARWQVNQGIYAIGSGGLFGKGMGDSTQKYSYVSEPQNDMIFAIVCEEIGFVGASLIILAYIFLIYRGVVIGLKAKSRFGAMLAMGIVFQIGLQVVLNIAVATDSIPNTGISLPFFSYGGTSLIVLLGEMGIVMSVSRDSRVKKK